MVYDEFRRHLGKAGLTIRQFADLLKMHPNSLTNYRKNGEVPTHVAIIAALMGEMADKKVDFKFILNGLEITSKRARGNPGRLSTKTLTLPQ